MTKKLVALAVLLLSIACGPLTTSVEQIDDTAPEITTGSQPESNSPTQTAEPPPTVAEEDNTTVAEVNCPTATEGTQVIRNDLGGYCFLAPADFDVRDEGNPAADAYDTWAMGEVLSPENMESPVYYLRVNVIGAPGFAGDLSAQAWVDEMSSPFGQIESLGTTTIAGQEVPVIIEPGMFAARSAYVNVDGTLYAVSTVHGEFLPEQEQRDTVDAYWAQALESMTFTQPQADTSGIAHPDDVCAEGAYVDYDGGFCFIIPEGWESDPTFPDRFLGGPVIGEFWPGSGDRAGFALGSQYGDFSDGFAAFVETRKANSTDPTQFTYELTTINGQEAAIVTNLGAPVPERYIFVRDGERMVTVVSSPWDEDEYPEAYAALEAAFTDLQESLVVFEPWN